MYQSRKTILLVEDEAIIALAESALLRRNGFEIITVYSGEAAVEAVDGNPGIDLVLMDIDLGSGIDGTEAAQTILSRHDIPLVFLSSHTEREVVEKTEGITSYGYIVKNSGETVMIASIKMAFRLFDARMKEIEREVALQESETKFRQLFEDHTAIKLIIDPETGLITEANRAAAEFYGWPVEILTTMTIDRINCLPPEEVRREMSRAREQNKTYFEFIHRKADGSTADVDVFSSSITIRGKEYLHSIIHDVTESRKNARALRESEQRYRRIYDHVAIGIAHVSLDFVIESANEAYCQLLGYSCSEIRGKHLKEITCPEIIEENLRMQEQLGRGELDHFRLEKAFRHRDGHTVYGILDANLIRGEGGEPLYFIGTVLDITRRKEFEEGLRTSDRVFNHSIDMLCIAGFDGYFKVLNPAWERTLGWSREELLAKPWSDFVHPEDRSATESVRVELTDGQQIYRFENRYRCRDGGYRWLSWNSFPYPEDGIIFGVARDITEMKEQERQMESEKARLMVTLESIGDGVVATDTQGRVTLLNAVAARLTGWSPEEAAGRPLEEVFEIVNARSREPVVNPVEKVLAEGVTVGLANHTVLVARDGREYQIADSAAPIRSSAGETIGVVLVFRDVTEAYAVRQALEESAREMARAQRMASLGSWQFDLNSRTVTASPETRRLYGVDEEASFTIADIQAVPLPEYREMLDLALEGLVREGRPYDVEFGIRRPSDGAIRRIHSIAEYDREQNRIIGTIQDITERVRAADEIRRLLAEKEILLRESHHRIKNNMAVIKNMLSLQGSAHPETAIRESLKEVEHRVQNMAVLYQKLYQSPDSGPATPGAFLSALVEEILDIYDTPVPVEFCIEVAPAADIPLPAKTLSPIGILINELLTNSVKHAFAERDRGKIIVRVEAEDGLLRLVYADDGKGLPEDAGETGGFGMQLVRMLARQINAELTIENRDGAVFTLRFPV